MTRRYPEPVTDTVALLGRGRDALARRAWREAFLVLSEADGAATLSALDLEGLAGLVRRVDQVGREVVAGVGAPVDREVLAVAPEPRHAVGDVHDRL